MGRFQLACAGPMQGRFRTVATFLSAINGSSRRTQARGCDFAYTCFSRSTLVCVYICVVAIEAWPSSS